ncbi:methyl-accepting chemotaxis protein [Halalkalibacter akibai]|uniref:Methyl-accepting chemotaxis sensory transducer n=1 Tax=Halalkalibacter akibai (strain ATCC 43226 / DSM 21942 / CIP 109018 / JCM 9157 / 1139) TaxID=1236973 RepID=W4QN16_HALA3|nr:HAMP domain-containing methyl-accepting chemotaxis protein [Halalkalibacter akibai]GAE33043.1 methyl-accepting chemotaxis sensory transducer [Halalkalibacter akibai JCM 9157]
MKFIKNLSIRAKLLGIFGSVIILFIGGFVASFLELDRAEEEVENLERRANSAIMATEIAALFRAKYIPIAEYARTGHFREVEFMDFDSKLVSIFERIESQLTTEQQMELFATIVQNNEKMDQIKDDFLAKQAIDEKVMEELGTIRHDTAMAALRLSDSMYEQFLGSGVETKEALAVTKMTLAMSVAVAFLIGTTLFVLFSKYISKALNNVVQLATGISQGNLQLEKIKVTSKDEIGKVSYSMNQMLDNLRHLLVNISQTTSQVAASSEQLTASAGETSKSTDSISQSIQEVASGTDLQVEGANTVTGAISEITSGMQQISSSMVRVNEMTSRSNDNAIEGVEVMYNSIEHMKNNINQKAFQTAGVVQQLGEKSVEIGEISQLITNVAEQTNLLALNAAIEAARAGEHGRGFAVVADEVRKLAEQSRQSAGQINSLISEIQTGIRDSVSSMDEVTKSVGEGIVFAEQAGTSFGDITGAISEVMSQVEEVSAAIQQMQSNTEAVNHSVKEMALIAENSASNTQNVAASAEEQNASMQEVLAAAETLNQMAEDLQKNVDTFKF